MEKIEIEGEQKGESNYKEATSDLKIQLNSSRGDSSDSSPKLIIAEEVRVESASSESSPVTESRPIAQFFTRGLYNTGLKIFYAMEFVGEIVCNIFGLNESKYQYVIDSMDADDWKLAKENEGRRNNDATLRAAV